MTRNILLSLEIKSDRNVNIWTSQLTCLLSAYNQAKSKTILHRTQTIPISQQLLVSTSQFGYIHCYDLLSNFSIEVLCSTDSAADIKAFFSSMPISTQSS